MTTGDDLLGLVGWSIFAVGALVRIAAVVEDAGRLRTTDGPDREDALRGSYVAIRLGAALTAIGLVGGLWSLLGELALPVALIASAPLLALVDLVPRAVASPAKATAGWSATWGARLGHLEHLAAGPDGPAWSHDGLTPLVRADPEDEDTTERHMARRVYDFGDVRVGDIMVPLVDVIAVRDDSPLREVIRIATREGYSRLPVFHERLPNVIGLLHVFDLLVPGDAKTSIDLMHEPTFVPEMTLASDVLRRLQSEGVNLAVVVDEYGGAVGIVAIEDILEEVVGEIEDEYDQEEDPVREAGPGAWIVDGRAEIERLNERFPWRLPEGDYETLGGLLLEKLARVPDEGDSLTLERVALRVTEASPRSVDEIRVDQIVESDQEESS